MGIRSTGVSLLPWKMYRNIITEPDGGNITRKAQFMFRLKLYIQGKSTLISSEFKVVDCQEKNLTFTRKTEELCICNPLYQKCMQLRNGIE